MVRYNCFAQLLNRKANPGHPACMYHPVPCDDPPSPLPPPQHSPESSLMLTGVLVKETHQNMGGVLAWSCLRTLLAAHREAPL